MAAMKVLDLLTRVSAALCCVLLGDALAQAGAPQSPPRSLLLKAAQFDPQVESPSIPAALQLTESQSTRYFIVQFDRPPTSADRAALESRGTKVFLYVPHDAYLVRLDETGTDLLTVDHVRAAVAFQPAFKIDPSLVAQLASPDEADYWVAFFEGAGFSGGIDAIVETGVEDFRTLEDGGDLVAVRARGDQLAALARIDGVEWIQRAPRWTRRNDSTTWVMQSNVSNQTPQWDHGLLGEGQIVGHIDGGIDLNNCYFKDPGHGSAGPDHRKVIYHDGGGIDDHGTHTAGTAAGDQEPINGSTFRNGIGYRAKIAHTNDFELLFTSLFTILDTHHDLGARMHTNSFGNDSTDDYDVWARDIDRFSYSDQESLACWAVSNGPKVTNPENAKNCLAVAGCDRAPNQEKHCEGGTGPTKDGRQKPEIYGSGCSVQSADAGSTCSTRSDTGTSMASPAIAGAGVLVRDYFGQGFYPSGTANPDDVLDPTGALVKAMLVNAAVDMTSINGGYPGLLEGWGRLDLDRTLFLADVVGPELFIQDVRHHKGFANAGETRVFGVQVDGSQQPLEISLVWHDRPAALFASFTPVNDLDLRVTSPAGDLYLGNHFSGGQSATGGSADTLNNVERVRRSSPVAGLWIVEVSASILPSPTQGFALAVNGDITPCANFENYGTGLAGSGGFVPTLTGLGLMRIGDTVTVKIEDGLGGTAGFLVMGFARAEIPLYGGTLLVQPPFIVYPITLGGTAGVAGEGNLSLSSPIPDDPQLIGITIDLQSILLDPGAVRGLSMTRGLEACIGG